MEHQYKRGVGDYLWECLLQFDYPLIGYGLSAALVVYLLLCTRMNTFFASNLVLLVGSLCLSIVGTNAYLSEPSPWTMSLTDEGSESALFISHIMVIYMLFNTVVTAQVKEMQSFTMIAHHVVTLLLAITSMGPFALNYGAYFFGVIEVTNFPLTVLELIDYYGKQPANDASKFAMIQTVAGGIFALLFYATRVVGWVVVSYKFWIQVVDFYAGNDDKGLAFTALLFMASNFFLTALQLKWSIEIAQEIRKILKGGDEPTKDDSKMDDLKQE